MPMPVYADLAPQYQVAPLIASDVAPLPLAPDAQARHLVRHGRALEVLGYTLGGAGTVSGLSGGFAAVMDSRPVPCSGQICGGGNDGAMVAALGLVVGGVAAVVGGGLFVARGAYDVHLGHTADRTAPGPQSW